MIFPPIMDSESLPGYEIRLAKIGQDRSVSSKVRETLCTGGLQFGSLPGNLANFVAKTGGVLGGIEDIVDRHTSIPIAMHLTMTKQQREHLLCRIRAGARSDRALRYSALGTGIFRTQRGYAYCQACARDDKEAVGFSFWRTQWLYHGIAACPIHNVSLTVGCGRCAESQPFSVGLRLPSTECSCGGVARPLLVEDSLDLQTHVRIARFMRETANEPRFFRGRVQSQCTF